VYLPQGPAEKQLIQELIDTSWRLNRVPTLEAEVLARAANPPTPEAAIQFDVAQVSDSLRPVKSRMRQFHKTLEQLRQIQVERRETERRDLKQAAALLEMHNVKGIRYDPAEDGFVFSLSHHPHPHHLPPTTYDPPSERPKTPFRVILKVATSAGIAT
jgi:hypothetical protein